MRRDDDDEMQIGDDSVKRYMKMRVLDSDTCEQEILVFLLRF